MSDNQLASVAVRWIEEIWRPGDLSTFDSLHAPDFLDRSPAGRPSDRESYRRSIEQLYEVFPDFYTNIDDLIVDTATGKIAIRWTATGTHRAKFMDVEPTRRMIRFQGIEIITVRDGQIVERWGEWDGLSIQAQLA